MTLARWNIKLLLVGMIVWAMPASAAEAPTVAYPQIHFQSDSTDVEAADLGKLAANIAWLKRYPQAVVILEGHCDDWGNAAYNMELGDRRARELKARLIAQGIMPERVIMVVSFGEAKPLDPGRNPAAWRANRRVEFVLR